MTPPNVALYDWIRRTFDFQGRSSRADYWWVRLFVFSTNLILLFVLVGALGPDNSQAILDWLTSGSTDVADLELGPVSSLAKFAFVFLMVFALLTFIPELSIGWRRFQDMGRPGWFHIIFVLMGLFTPFIMFAEYIWFAFPGQSGANRYGPDPYENRPDIF